MRRSIQKARRPLVREIFFRGKPLAAVLFLLAVTVSPGYAEEVIPPRGPASQAISFPAPRAEPAASGELPPKPEKIPVEAFAKTPFISDPVLSPSGLRIAARFDVDGRSLLGIRDVQDKSGHLKFLPFNNTDLRWYRWANRDDRLLVSTSGWLGSRLFVFDLATEGVRFLGMKKQSAEGDDVLYVSDDGGYLLLALAQRAWPAVYRVNLVTGEMVEVVASRLPIVQWYADSKGIVRVGVGYSTGRITLIYREDGQSEFKTVAKAKLDDLLGDFDTIRFRTMGDGGLVLSNVKNGRFALYEFDWKTFEVGQPVFEHPTVDIDSFRLSEDGTEVEAVFYTDDRQRVVWFEPEMKELQTEIDDALKGRMNWITSASRDRSRFLVWTGTADDPGHYYYYNRPAGVMSRLATPIEVLKGKRLAPVTLVSYKSHDGLEIPAYLTLPVGRPAKDLPLIIMPHGGPHVRDDWSYNPWVQLLANRGYAVLQPNFRGSAGYGKDYMAKGFGQWGRGMQDDLTAGLQWLVSQGIADPKRACIMGASYGGYAAMMGAIETPDLYRCAISFAGVTDVNDMMKYDGRHMIPSRYKRWREMVRGEEEADLRAVSPVNRADEVSIPLLLAHGTKDGNVPYRQAEKMVQALKKAGKPFEFLEFKGAGHGFDSETDRARFLTAVDAFLAKHNPAD